MIFQQVELLIGVLVSDYLYLNIIISRLYIFNYIS